jgi:glycosyltransferase involved in cell wall biosynthesis
MNILQVINSLDCGGLEKLTLDLVKGLKSRGHNVTICCLEGLGELYGNNLDGVEAMSLKKKTGLDIGLPFRLASYIRQKRPSVIHTHNPGPLLYGTIAGRIAGVPVIINTRHGRAARHTSGLIWKMNDSLVAISHDAKNELLKTNTVKPGKIAIIHNGVNLKEFNSNPENSLNEKKKLGLEASYIIGTVSRLSWEKDQFALIKAFTKVAAVEPCAKLVFVGDGDLRNDLESLAKKLGLGDKVIFLSFRNDISSVIRSFDIFALSSLMEGISLSLLEAMASRKPVVVTDVGGNPEVVVDGVTGFLVPPKEPQKMADAIVKIMQNPELAQKMGEAGRRRVEAKFSLERSMSDCMWSAWRGNVGREDVRALGREDVRT